MADNQIPVSRHAEIIGGRWVTLVAVEVFGGTDECAGCGQDLPWSYGLCDAVPGWSDCNRAIGHVFRINDIDERDPDHVVRIWVPDGEWEKLAVRVWGEGHYDGGRTDQSPQ